MIDLFTFALWLISPLCWRASLSLSLPQSTYSVSVSLSLSADLNECGLKPRPCKHRCMNTYGSYKCYCLNGYMLMPDGTCGSECVSLTNTHTNTHLCDYYWLKGGYFHPLSIFSLTCCCFLISLLVCSLGVLLWSFSSLHSRCVHLNACTGQCHWHTFSIMKYISYLVWARLTVDSQSFDRLLWLKPRVDLLHYSSSAVWRTPVKNPTRAKMKIWKRQSYDPWVNVQVLLVALWYFKEWELFSPHISP